MILLDTTILCYAVGDVHPLREPCRRLLRAHGDGRVEATTTVEAVQEFLHVRARRRSRADAAELAGRYAAVFALLATTPDDLVLGMKLFESHTALGAFDAVLAAVALNNRVEALVSADHGFGVVQALRWIDPLGPAFARLVAI